MKIGDLVCGISNLDIRGKKGVAITGISSDSRTLAPGNLFIARKGTEKEGAQYIPEALLAGARAIVTDVYDPFLDVTQVIHPEPHRIESSLAARYYGEPAKQLYMVGVTGTKGKTTTTYLARHLLEKMGVKTGLLNSIEALAGDMHIASDRATNGPIFNHKWLQEMVTQKCKAAVMEASSHGLEQGRVAGIAWDVGVFTNLYVDHLDYHITMEKYAEAKKKLFSAVKGVAIFNADSPWSSSLRVGGNELTFGIEKEATLQAKDLALTIEGVQFSVEGITFKAPLIGRFNVYNLLGALGVGVAKGYSLKEMGDVFCDFPGTPGRLQKVFHPKGIHVFVDFSHMGAALQEVLQTLKSLSRGRILVVFGCGGNKDPTRRKTMAEAAEKYGDIAFVTNDNPRGEDPEEICRQILASFKSLRNVVVELDREKAIARAIHMASPGDIVLIAGKGHEKMQIFSNKTVIFDDVAIAQKICKP